MMKIIDMRCRPPFGYFINTGLFQPADMPFSADRFALRFGRVHAESARKKSFDLFLQEMKDAGITKAVVPVRRQQDSDNDTLVELLAQYPDLFIGSAGINHRDSEQAIGQIKKYVVEGPCKTLLWKPGWADHCCMLATKVFFLFMNTVKNKKSLLCYLMEDLLVV